MQPLVGFKLFYNTIPVKIYFSFHIFFKLTSPSNSLSERVGAVLQIFYLHFIFPINFVFPHSPYPPPLEEIEEVILHFPLPKGERIGEGPYLQYLLIVSCAIVKPSFTDSCQSLQAPFKSFFCNLAMPR